jgi:hypothetical protein
MWLKVTLMLVVALAGAQAGSGAHRLRRRAQDGQRASQERAAGSFLSGFLGFFLMVETTGALTSRGDLGGSLSRGLLIAGVLLAAAYLLRPLLRRLMTTFFKMGRDAGDALALGLFCIGVLSLLAAGLVRLLGG